MKYFLTLLCLWTVVLRAANPSTTDFSYVNVEWPPYNARGDGVTDDTTAIQLAVNAAVSQGKKGVKFSPTANGYLTRIIYITNAIELVGENTKIIQQFAGTEVTPGTYTASPVFMVRRDADNVRISGFDFYSSGTFPAGWSAPYYAPIIAFHADGLVVERCNFRGTNNAGIFQHGGNFARIENNNFWTNTITIHNGWFNNPYFYDSGSATNEPLKSPIGTMIVRNVFTGSDPTSDRITCFLSGANGFTVEGNKFLNMNVSATRGPIRVYANDLGISDIAGTMTTNWYGVIHDNYVQGTFDYGIHVDGNSTSLDQTNLMAYIRVSKNTVLGTGNGINLQHAPHATVSENAVTVTKSPLYLTMKLNDILVKDNRFESTTEGLGSRTLFTSTAAYLNDARFEGNEILTAPADVYLFTDQGIGTTNLVFNRNNIQFRHTAADASRRVLQFLLMTGRLEVSDNKILSENADTAIQTMLVVNTNLAVEMRRNRMQARNGTYLRGANVTALKLEAEGNESAGWEVNTVGRAVLNKNLVLCDTAAFGTAVQITAGTQAVLSQNDFRLVGAINNAVVAITDTPDSRAYYNTITNNSTVAALRALNTGTLRTLGNTFTNAGGGGFIGATGTAVAEAQDNGIELHGDVNVNLTQYSSRVHVFTSTLTGGRDCNMPPTGGLERGHEFVIIRQSGGAYILNCDGYHAFPANTTGFVVLTYDGTTWQVTASGKFNEPELAFGTINNGGAMTLLSTLKHYSATLNGAAATLTLPTLAGPNQIWDGLLTVTNVTDNVLTLSVPVWDTLRRISTSAITNVAGFSGDLAFAWSPGLSRFHFRQDATSSGVSLADPSGTIDGTAANGVATTALRSDGRHALANPFTPASGTQTNIGGLNVSTLGTFGSVTVTTNLGVGTASPSQKFQVVGNAPEGILGAFESASGKGITFNPNTASGIVSIYSDYLGGSEPKLHLSSYTDRLGAGGIHIHSGGGVSIGNTTDPGAANLRVTGLISHGGLKSVTTQYDSTDTTLGTVTGLSVTVAASTKYRFSAVLFVDTDAVGGHKYAIAGTATATAVIYQVNSINNGSNAFRINSRQTALGGAGVGEAIGTAYFTTINGTITVNAGGTLLVQFAQNADTGTSSVLVGSTFEVEPLQ